MTSDPRRIISEILRIQKEVREIALVLQSRINAIENDVKRGKVDDAIDKLHSRFFNYRPLRHMLQLMVELEKLESSFRKLERTRRLNHRDTELWFALENAVNEIEDTHEDVFGRWLVREMGENGDLDAALENMKKDLTPQKVNNQTRVGGEIGRIGDRIAALILLTERIQDSLRGKKNEFKHRSKSPDEDSREMRKAA